MQQRRGRWLERIFLTGIMILLGLLFYDLFAVYQRKFADIPKRLSEGSIVNLNGDKVSERLRNMLERGYYYEDKRDIDVIVDAVSKGLSQQQDPLDNIGELNKNKFAVPADEAYQRGGESFRKRVNVSRSLIGFSNDDSLRFQQEQKAPQALPATVPVGMGNATIKGTIIDRQKNPAAGVLVRLEMLFPEDSLYDSEVTEVENIRVERTPTIRREYVLDSQHHRQLQSLTAYARTDAEGKYQFTELASGRSFQVLPLKPGFQYGPYKGVVELGKTAEFSFVQQPHQLRLFSGKDFNNLKKEGSLIVRTPEEATKWYWIIIGVFLGAFLLIHIILSIRFKEADQLILPVVLLLTGLSLLTLLSLQDPLRDRFLGRSTIWYFAAGFIGLIIILLFDLRRLTPDSGFYRLLVFKNKPNAGKGWPWALAASGFLMLTILLGSGPEGSGVKVNLFGFQPSEIVKFLIVFFLAGFFTLNERFLAEYTSFQKRWRFFYIALGAILLSLFLFLILGDLGPAIVVCFTFIILFSFSRGDFAFMVGAVVLYVLANWFIKNVWIATGVTLVILLMAMALIRKQISESAIMALAVIAGFLLIDEIPYLDKLIPGPVQRLTDRKAIWQNAWDNEVYGGDQVANGIWAMSSGGVTGQGIGEGFAKTIPEAHTDMILPSIGEEFGWTGIICVFILFLIYLHRSIIIGRQTGRSFLFYICAGIGISTFIQFLLIAGGSIGALPLSGVALPFISYGGTSLIVNLLAAGFLLSSSVIRGSAVQMTHISKQQDRNLIPALIAACVGIILLSVNVSRYLFNNEKWVVQPSLVADRSGARMFSYNPRIAILINRLQAGSLYDRNGVLMATSKPELLLQQRDTLNKSGVLPQNLLSLSHKRLDRYYPFAEHMFFWTGDANTGVFMGANNGYFAEYALDAELRGFPTPAQNYNVTAHRFREDRFLPQTVQEMVVTHRDYSALAPLLLAGINSKEVESFKQRNRDVQLTMDAGLQTHLQQALQGYDSTLQKRVSIVVMDDASGDVLTSAAYPLPPVNDWDRLTLTRREQNKFPGWLTLTDLGFTYTTQPGSTAKIATALAAFNKLGDAAATKTIVVRPQDLIRIKSAEPDEPGNITLERAIVKSNNSYFIKLANEERLQEEMGTVYLQTGMFLHGVGGYFFERNPNNADKENDWRKLWRKTEFRSVNSYNPNDIKKTRGRGVSGMAWGQGELVAAPAAVARMVSGVANDGVMIPNRYVLKISDSALGVAQGVRIAQQPSYAQQLTQFMLAQSAGKADKLHLKVAGKTGTPERIWKGRRINDGWYVFFAPKQNGTGHIVTCIRIEATKGSSDAVKLAGDVVIPELLKRGYIKSFEGGPIADSTRMVLNNR